MKEDVMSMRWVVKAVAADVGGSWIVLGTFDTLEECRREATSPSEWISGDHYPWASQVDENGKEVGNYVDLQ
jgi:hypothetical protein